MKKLKYIFLLLFIILTFSVFSGCGFIDFLERITKPSSPPSSSGSQTPEPDLTLIKFNSNGGTGGTESVVAEIGKPVPSEDINPPERDGYIFNGYYSDGGIKYYNYLMQGAVTHTFSVNTLELFAHWQKGTAGLTFLEYNGTMLVTGVTGSFKDIMIPKEIDGLPVAGIADRAFSDTNVKTVYSLSNLVLTLGTDALPVSFERIDVSPNIYYDYLADSAWAGYPGCIYPYYNLFLEFSLTEDKTGYIVSLGERNTDTVITVPGTYDELPIVRVAENGFKDSVVEQINLPDTIESIGRSAFSGSAIFDLAAPGIVYADNWVIGAKNYTGNSITIVSGTVGIADYAFEEISNTLIITATLPEGIKYIGSYAFVDFNNMTTLNIPDSVVYFPLEAVYRCAKLTNLYMSTGIIEMIAQNVHCELIGIHNDVFTVDWNWLDQNGADVTVLGAYLIGTETIAVRKADGNKYSIRFLATLAHEIRHHYQRVATHGVTIKGVTENINTLPYPRPTSQQISDWSRPYIDPGSDNKNFDAYWKQPVEVDARNYATLRLGIVVSEYGAVSLAP